MLLYTIKDIDASTMFLGDIIPGEQFPVWFWTRNLPLSDYRDLTYLNLPISIDPKALKESAVKVGLNDL